MTLEQLNMLRMVAREGTLKAASQKIFKTQAAISQGIKQLESHLGVMLFDRKGYRLVLTVEGEQIYQLATRLLDQANEIESLSNHFTSGNEPKISIAVNASFEMRKIFPVLEQIQEAYPETQIVIEQEYLTGAIEALSEEKADIAITAIGDSPVIQNQFESFLFCQACVIRVAAPKLLNRHPNLQCIKELEKEYQIIIQDSGSGTKGKTYGVADGQRRWLLNDLFTKKTLMLNGLGWGALPLHMIEDELKAGSLIKLKFKDSETEFKLNYLVIKQRNRLLGPVASTLWESMKALKEMK